MCHKTNWKDLELVYNLLLWIHFIWVYVIVINDLEGTHAHTHIHVNIHYDVHTHTHTHTHTYTHTHKTIITLKKASVLADICLF